MKLDEIDKNFKIEETINKEGLKFYNAEKEPFKIYGLIREGDRFRRLPGKVAKSVNEGVYALHANTAGGRVRFITDSETAAIIAVMDKMYRASHFPFTGTAGFDIYSDGIYKGTFRPQNDAERGFEGIIGGLEKGKMKEITINFPLYSDVKELFIGLAENAEILSPMPYKNEKPVVFYGSSITQGGCASRPGRSYQAVVSRRLNIDYVNLGFSGSARAEDEIIEYIKNLDMAAFVYDYDHNAPNVAHLEATHEKMFKAVREAQPRLPIIIMPRPKYYLNDEEKKRRDIILKTYNNAVAAGDKNVYFIDNTKLTAECKGEGTVDNTHPTDFGFASMAKAVGDCLEKIL